MLTVIVSAAALLVSIAAFVHSVRSSKVQSELTLREIELVRIQIANEHEKKKSVVSADVSSRLYCLGSHKWRVRTYNRGPGNALNVSIASDNTGYIIDSEKNDKLPLRSLESGHSVDLLAAIHLQSKRKAEITLVWMDTSGKEHTKEVALTF
mgnify:CR=1 FL=1